MAGLVGERGIMAINKRGRESTVCQTSAQRKSKHEEGQKKVDGRWRILAYQIVSVITVLVLFRPVSLRRWISEVLMIRATPVDMEKGTECEIDTY